MQNLTENNITNSALDRISDCRDLRFKNLMTAFIRHLHDFAREVTLTPEEWHAAIEFLTAVGHITDDKRQEFILLSDILGLSALVDLIANAGKPSGATESSLLGPFYVEGVPEMPLNADIAGETAGERIVVRGSVRSTGGEPIAGALIEVWQAAPNGLYDVQDESRSEINLRGTFRSDDDGMFVFRSVKTASYPVPSDGPAGKMLRALGRHPYRPAHVHFKISAPNHQTLTTALYLKGDKYLDSDAVFGSRQSLVVGYRPSADDSAAIEALDFDFVLSPERATANILLPSPNAIRG
jgi:protocatechuate 3,4-dioxygenase beta subunit